VVSAPAWAYYGVLDTGEVMGAGKYKATGSSQFVTDSGGMNVGGRFDAGFQDEFGVRGIVGFGKTDFFLGGMVKWVPIPDIDKQPAIGFGAGLVYGQDNDYSDLSFRFEPIASKKFDVNGLFLTPYVSLPISSRMRKFDNAGIKDDNDVVVQLVVGSQVQVEQLKDWQFIGEVGVDLNDAPSFFTVGAIYYFDTN
jgi:hypothetical protein